MAVLRSRLLDIAQVEDLVGRDLRELVLQYVNHLIDEVT